jgi:hypothetical protein
MSIQCPNCGYVIEDGGASSGLADALRQRGEPDLEAIAAEMMAADPSSVPVSEAMPFEAMQAEPGMVLALDEQGEPLQTSEEQVAARGLRRIPPGGVPASPDAMAQALRTRPRR